MKDLKKTYSNSEIDIHWQPALCIHAAECIKALPKVYNPRDKPWLKIENASTEELKAQIAKCPSGALSYSQQNVAIEQEKDLQTKVQVKHNGPLIIHGNLRIIDKDGKEVSKENATTFCRCGASKNKPFCDGSHSKIGFEG